jgi:hypothetical protein
VNTPVTNLKVARTFQRAFNRLRGVILWQSLLKDIKLYGTSTNLYDKNFEIAKNLTELLRKKSKKIKASDERLRLQK